MDGVTLLVDGGDLQCARSDALDELNAAAVCRYERDFLGAIIAHDEAVYALYQKRQRELLRGNFKPAGSRSFSLPPPSDEAVVKMHSHLIGCCCATAGIATDTTNRMTLNHRIRER
jgi:hypothetical protein